MKKIIFVLMVVGLASCGKKQCYTCTTTDYSQLGTPPQSFEKCATSNQIKRFEKNNTHKENSDPNIYGPKDKVTICVLN